MVENQQEAKQRCVKYRKRILGLSQKLGALHIAPAFSCLEIVDAIYCKIMRPDNLNTAKFLDSFILSKGHGALAQYVVLEHLGILLESDLDNLGQSSGKLGGHPDYGVPGIEASTGSLGHGLPIALGMALADKIFGIDRIVYIVMSDAEMQEGSVWEAMLLAPNLSLSNLVVFIDSNDFQVLDRISKINPNFYPIKEKVRAFGWETIEIDGHNSQLLYEGVVNRTGKRPFMVIAKTIKGKSVSFMENNSIWNFRSPSKDEYELALKELDEGIPT